MITHQLQVRCRPVKVRRSETDVLPLSYTANILWTQVLVLELLNNIVFNTVQYSCQIRRYRLISNRRFKCLSASNLLSPRLTSIQYKISCTYAVTRQEQPTRSLAVAQKPRDVMYHLKILLSKFYVWRLTIIMTVKWNCLSQRRRSSAVNERNACAQQLWLTVALGRQHLGCDEKRGTRATATYVK